MIKNINYIWRVIATGICFSIFGLGGLFLSITVFPLQKLIVKDDIKQKKIARNTVHHSFKLFLATMSFLGIFKFSLEDVSELKDLKGRLVLANHPSLIDVVVLISIIPNADCVVKAHLFNNFFLRGVVKNTGYISNTDPEGLLQDCKESLDLGNNLIIFPEGTRSKPKDTLSFQRGAANIAIRCQANVISVLLKLTPCTLTKGEPWYRIPATKAHFSAKLVTRSPKIPEYIPIQVSKIVRDYNRILEIFFIKELKQYE